MEVLFIVSAILSLATLGTLAVFSRRVRRIGKAYVAAKTVVSEVVFSFNRDLQQQADLIQSLSERLERLSSAEHPAKSIEELFARLRNLESEHRSTSSVIGDISGKFQGLIQNFEDVLKQQGESRTKMEELEERLEEGKRRELLSGVDRIEAAIPIRKGKALARLTDTELAVLGTLAGEGEKSASQIRDKIGLSREHTARLMKSLHARGYVERNTDRLPYVYRIKDEMLGILKGGETSNAL